VSDVGGIDVIDEKMQAALSQIGREEKAAAADKVSPIVRHRASIAQLKAMGFAEPVIEPATSGRTRWLNPSYGLRKGGFPVLQAFAASPQPRIQKPISSLFVYGASRLLPSRYAK
jgi:hypothetical protein